MYKISHEKAQAGRDRITLADIATAGPPELQTDEQRRRNIKLANQRLEARIMGLPKNSPERRELGLEKLRLQAGAQALGLKKQWRGLEALFFSAAKEMLPRGTYELILARAKADCAAQQKQRGEESHAKDK